MSRRIAVQQDRIFLRSMCLYCHLDSLIQTFHRTDIYLLSKMGFRGLKLLWMSVLCKAGDLGKLRQIWNSGHSKVNMFLKTLLKAYVHIKDIKRQCIGILFFPKELFNHMNMCQIIFLFGKTAKVKNFLNPLNMYHFSSILRVHERWKFPSNILSYRHDITLKFLPRIPLRSGHDWWHSSKWCVIYRPKTNLNNVTKNVNWR